MTDIDAVLLDTLNKTDDRGWALMAVLPDGSGPDIPYVYTIGLTTLGHPELAIFGIGPEIGGALLNAIGDRIGAGLVLAHGDRVAGVLRAPPLVAITMDDTRELVFAHAVYDTIEAFQIVWPDPADRMPWESGYSMTTDAQPLFGPAG